jgi:O-antigen/teichoic acid export membrane protein
MASIAKNTFYLTFSSILQRILAFVFFTLIARTVGIEVTGRYSFALSFALLFSILADFGLTSVAVREASRKKEAIHQIFNTVFGIKLFLGVITFALIFLTINLMNYSSEAKFFVYLAALVMILDSVHLTLYGALRSFFNLKYEAVGLIFSQIIVLLIGGFVLISKINPAFLFLALGTGSIFNITFASLVLKIKYGIVFYPKFEKQFFSYLFKIAFQFALAGIFVKVYSYVDMVLLSYFKGEMYAGWYSIPVKLTFAFQFIPMAMVAAVYPAMSYYFSCSLIRLRQTFEKSLIYLAIIALPLSFGTIILADKVIFSLYGSAYAPSIIPLQIMTLSLFFAFLDFPVGSVLNACDKQHLQTGCLGITMVVNIILNLILIPKYSMIGAAFTAFLTYLILFVTGMVLVRRVVKYRLNYLLISFLKIFFAASLMAFVINLLVGIIHWIILVPLGVIFYFIFLYLFKGISFEEIRYFWNVLRNKSEESL